MSLPFSCIDLQSVVHRPKLRSTFSLIKFGPTFSTGKNDDLVVKVCNRKSHQSFALKWDWLQMAYSGAFALNMRHFENLFKATNANDRMVVDLNRVRVKEIKRIILNRATGQP